MKLVSAGLIVTCPNSKFFNCSVLCHIALDWIRAGCEDNSTPSAVIGAVPLINPEQLDGCEAVIIPLARVRVDGCERYTVCCCCCQIVYQGTYPFNIS